MSTYTEYLADLCKEHSRATVEFLPSPEHGGGLGGFARQDISPGEVVFAIPRYLILSSSSPTVSADPDVRLLAADKRVTAETLLFAYMALRWSVDAAADDAGADVSELDRRYLASLPRTVVPLDPEELAGTNVGAQCRADASELRSQHALVDAVLPGRVSLPYLTRAKAVYNSRRYPVEFALTCGREDVVVVGGGGSPADGGRSASKKRRLVAAAEPSPAAPSGEGRAVYDPTQGCLCPLLDVLNHRSGDHLSFEVTPKELLVISKKAVAKGEEIFSNYDCASNDQFLLQFGFCDKSDAALNVFTVKVAGRRFDLRRDKPVPDELLGDGGHGLEAHLRSKLEAMPSPEDPPSDNPEVAFYMSEQRNLVEYLIEEVRQVIAPNV